MPEKVVAVMVAVLGFNEMGVVIESMLRVLTAAPTPLTNVG